MIFTPNLTPLVRLGSTIYPFNTWMVVLTIWIILTIILIRFNTKKNVYFLVLITALILILTGFFLVDNFLIIYIFFEMSIIPTFFLIIGWGGQPERLLARWYFMLYTIVGSLPIIASLIIIENVKFRLNINQYYLLIAKYPHLLLIQFIPFCVKIPMWGAHIWLPKAHVEAPVRGSIILAGLLLKTGGYGIIKYSIAFTPNLLVMNSIYSINLWSLVVVRLICLTLVDIKLIIAYTSIAHIALMTIALLSMREIGLLGSKLIIISHGLISPLLFAMAHINYKRANSRNLLLHKGIISSVTAIWFLALAGNIAAPPSLNLVREIFIRFALTKWRMLSLVFIGVATILRACYRLYIYSAISGYSDKVNNFPNSGEKTTMAMLLTPSFLFFSCVNIICSRSFKKRLFCKLKMYIPATRCHPPPYVIRKIGWGYILDLI